MKRNLSVLLFGVILLIAGFCYLGSIFFDYSFTIFFDGWWTMFIIVPAFISMLSNGPRSVNIGALLIGVFLLLVQLDFIPSRYLGEYLLALIILYIGVALIVRYIRGPKPIANFVYNSPPNNAQNAGNYEPNNAQTNNNSFKYSSIDSNDFPSHTAVLSGVEVSCNSVNFKGARLAAILGGVEIDLRNVIITSDITIYATAVLGGIDILAPQNVRIALNKTDILGGTDCKAQAMPSDANVPLVNFVTTSILGGIDIK